ncbi:MAG: hypothetical protein Q9169_003523 [Polycauliona sp. 2 TL-2023]
MRTSAKAGAHIVSLAMDEELKGEMGYLTKLKKHESLEDRGGEEVQGNCGDRALPPAAFAVAAENGTVWGLVNVLGTAFSNAPQRHDYHASISKNKPATLDLPIDWNDAVADEDVRAAPSPQGKN